MSHFYFEGDFRHPNKEDMYNSTKIANHFEKELYDWLTDPVTEQVMYRAIICYGLDRSTEDYNLLTYEKIIDQELFPDLILFDRVRDVIWIHKSLLPCLLRWCSFELYMGMDSELIANFGFDVNKNLSEMIRYFI